MTMGIRQGAAVRALSLLAALVLALGLAGCNTLEGAGEDIEAVGETLEEASEENAPY